MDVGEVADKLAHWLTCFQIAHPTMVPEGWSFNGLDIGEVEVTTEDGECFRLSVEFVENGFD